MPKKAKLKFGYGIFISTSMIAALFAVKGAELLFHQSWERFGILPRTEPGLIGILCSPFLHANLQHLLANAVPLSVLLAILFSNPLCRPWRTLLFIWLASGLGTWLIGRGGAVHIGASSIVFGLAAFLIMAGWTLKNWRAASIAFFVFFFYGGIFYGALPQAGPISWEGHLCGTIAGGWGASRL